MKSFLSTKNFSLLSRIKKVLPPKKQNPTLEKAYPKQHPRKLDSSQTEIIAHKPSTKFITPEKEVPYSLYDTKEFKIFESPKDSRFLTVSLVGPPNSGKSSLLNKLIGTSVSAVSSKANTTYDPITAVSTNLEERTQIIFYDTPGITQNKRKSKFFVSRAWQNLIETDKCLVVIDCMKRVDNLLEETLRRLNKIKDDEETKRKVRRSLNGEDLDKEIDQMLKDQTFDGENVELLPKCLVVNKIDLCSSKRELRALVSEIEDLAKFDKVFYTSCETGYGIQELLKYCEGECYNAKWQYPSDVNTTLSDAEKMEELMKAAVFNRFYHELPYNIGVNLTEFAIMNNGRARLEFTLDVENQTQMKMVIGHRGRNINELRERVSVELVRLFKKEFHVTIRIIERDESLEEINQQMKDLYPKDYDKQEILRKIEEQKRKRRLIAREILNLNEGSIE